MVRYATSVNDLDTIFCFLQDQDIALGLRQMMYAAMDFMFIELHPSQSHKMHVGEGQMRDEGEVHCQECPLSNKRVILPLACGWQLEHVCTDSTWIHTTQHHPKSRRDTEVNQLVDGNHKCHKKVYLHIQRD